MPRYDTSHQIFDDAVGGTSVKLRKLISYITSRCEPTSLVQKVASQCREACLKRLRFLFGYGIPFKRFSSTNMDDLAAVSSLRIGAKDKWQCLYYDQYTPCSLHLWFTWRYAKVLLIWEHSSVVSFYGFFTRDGFDVWIHKSVCWKKGCFHSKVFLRI